MNECIMFFIVGVFFLLLLVGRVAATPKMCTLIYHMVLWWDFVAGVEGWWLICTDAICTSSVLAVISIRHSNYFHVVVTPMMITPRSRHAQQQHIVWICQQHARDTCAKLPCVCVCVCGCNSRARRNTIAKLANEPAAGTEISHPIKPHGTYSLE